MMLVSGLYKIEQLADLDVDAVYIGIEGLSWRCAAYFKLDELSELSKKADALHKELWVMFNRMYEEGDLSDVKKALMLCQKMGIRGIVYCSLAVYELAIALSYEEVLIYQSDTLITNYHDATFFAQRNRAVIIAKEITLSDIKKITKDDPDKYGLIIHGHLNMSYSKRKFISNYLNNYNLKVKAENYYIQEETRDLKMPITEEKYGTSIYTAWILESLKQLGTLAGCCKYLLIDPLFLGYENQKQTIECYRRVLNQELSDTDAEKLLPEIKDHPYRSGFHFRKTTKGKVTVDE